MTPRDNHSMLTLRRKGMRECVELIREPAFRIFPRGTGIHARISSRRSRFHLCLNYSATSAADATRQRDGALTPRGLS